MLAYSHLQPAAASCTVNCERFLAAAAAAQVLLKSSRTASGAYSQTSIIVDYCCKYLFVYNQVFDFKSLGLDRAACVSTQCLVTS
jgi:hypothetical protein